MPNSETAAFLGQVEIFSDLDQAELAELAQIVVEYEFDQGAVIAYQRDIAERFIIVREGRLFGSSVDQRGVVRHSQSYFPKDYLLEGCLFTSQTHQATLKAATDGKLLCIEREKFLDVLDNNPYMADFLRLSDETADLAALTNIEPAGKRAAELDMLPQERIRYLERRSVWRLVLQVLGPILLFLVWVLFASLAFEVNGLQAVLAIALPGAAVFLYGVWRTMDWANDYFVITDKQIIHHEYNLRGFQVRIDKIPIDQVQSVEIEKPSLLATILQIGTATITTAAQHSTMRFDNIDNPRQVLKVINELREQSKSIGEGQAQADMRVALEEHFQVEPALRPVEKDEEEDEDLLYDEMPTVMERFADGLIALVQGVGRIAGTRIEDGDVITYRKHPFTLLGRTWWIILLSLALFALMIWVNAGLIRNILLVLWLGSIGWFGWRFLDWRNDLFQLTDLYVFDIDRLPLGFGESKKQAELVNIQNVNAERPGFLATLLNFGNVYIETAGASADIIFERVANPTQVQNDVFRRRESLRQKQADTERNQRRKEYAVMLDVYHQAQQAGRVPNRLATDDSL